MTVREAVEEPMRLSGCFQDGAAERALEDVGLFACDSFLTRHIHALSGGQRQRVAIARALTMELSPPHCRRAHLHAGPLGQGQPAADAQGPPEQPGLLHAVHHPRSGQRPEDLRPSLPPGGGRSPG
ncbi:ATP-binding cassette domain-containing protein [Flavonifractor plautii]|nr:ATP-binding cassette domain-containing protein [Flavonifractor plautii]